MYQSFDVTARPEQGPPRLQKLRRELERVELDGFLIPRADAHQGEYVSERDERLAWVTGFTGSAGFCAALRNSAGVFIDGRYRSQVKQQVALDFTPVPWPEVSLAEWLIEQLPQGGTIGFDPWHYSAGQIAQLEQALSDHDIHLRQSENLVDLIWDDQPAAPSQPVTLHPDSQAGETVAQKTQRLSASLKSAGQSAAVLTLPDSIMWLLNIRGSDVAHHPVALCFAVLHDTGRVDLFIEADKLAQSDVDLGRDVTQHAPSEFLDFIGGLNGSVLVDKATVPQIVADRLGTRMQAGVDLCALPKAIKNTAEVEGSAAAHLRDGAAVVELLAWLDTQAPDSCTEIDIVKHLEELRRLDPALREISFDTIAGTGPNGAIMHYRVTEETNATLEDGQLLVLDSGGQYLDGTTDITRTIAIGTPGAEEGACFTRVLQGMIAMSRLRWPRGLAGRDIECVGRMPLWLAEQDFNHGLGHGVGAYLSVHEGPQRLSRTSDVALQEGMILSNEPGYYREGAFGIRIENLVVVEKATALPGGDAERDFLSWRTLTYAPIDRRLIVADMLSTDEKDWLNTYHSEVAEKLAPYLTPHAKAWLAEATQEV
ncbi:aminopeptidase P family protein [Epibacterium ulvae]|uniref:aminopeptidase P family protein n=1 Tax=Epibacterium ulvae TaxID=1156985 RepID=UPI001BFC3329|nr:aminopeptidase P family protein [Epibacterium ulvae]MBT8153713.1 aminopeptidase P family protein [Epibacterium ulvae]